LDHQQDWDDNQPGHQRDERRGTAADAVMMQLAIHAALSEKCALIKLIVKFVGYNTKVTNTLEKRKRRKKKKSTKRVYVLRPDLPSYGEANGRKKKKTMHHCCLI
jgi:hypothetical protein